MSKREGIPEEVQNYLSRLTLKPEVEGILITTREGRFIASTYDSNVAFRHSEYLEKFMDATRELVRAFDLLDVISLIRIYVQEREIDITVDKTFLMATLSNKSTSASHGSEEEKKEIGQST